LISSQSLKEIHFFGFDVLVSIGKEFIFIDMSSFVNDLLISCIQSNDKHKDRVRNIAGFSLLTTQLGLKKDVFHNYHFINVSS
jgi:hypothetical protein